MISGKMVIIEIGTLRKPIPVNKWKGDSRRVSFRFLLEKTSSVNNPNDTEITIMESKKKRTQLK
jgi:hypothetical protein